MIKSTLALASLGFVLALASAQAQTAAPMAPMTCSQAELTKMDAEAAKMTDATKKTATMKEMTMAKDMMAKNDMKGCMTHMDNAMKMMPGKS